MSGPDTPAPDDGSTVDYWQVAFALLALVGLVLAAFAIPAVPVDAPDAGDSGDQEVDSDGGDGSGIPGFIMWLLWLLSFLIPDEPPENGDGTASCEVFLDRQPAPGIDVTVTVLYEGQPVEGATVWFDDKHVGETNATGQVTGEVPYSDELDVQVASDELASCEDVDDPTGAPSVARGQLAATTFTSSEEATMAATAEDGNVSITRSVGGDVGIEILDRPYPGEHVEIRAAIRGVPMGEAEVSVGGDPVAETDDEGRATVEIPDDGSAQVQVTVSRGDFSETATVEIHLLEANLHPAGLVLVPAGEATVVAEKGDEPEADAEVTVEDEYVGTTDREGEQSVALPADPTEPVTVSTDRQTTSVSLLGLYWLPLSVFGVLTAVSGGVARHYYGRPGLLGVLGIVGALATVVVAGGYWWPEGSLLVGGAFAALGFGALLVTYRRTVRREAASASGFLVRLLEGLVARILWVVGFLERLLDYVVAGVRTLYGWTRAALDRLRSLPRSVSGLFVHLAGWIRALPRRVLAAVRVLPGDRRLATKAVATLALCTLAIGGGYHLDGPRGAGLAALGVVLVAVFAGFARWKPSRESTPASSDEPAIGVPGSDGTAPPARPAAEGDWTLRQLWRAFASRVVPSRWRTRTPVEVSHAALEQGYPRTPVSELTAAFREVEYGNRTPTELVRNRAARAYESLVGTNTGDADSDLDPEDRGHDRDGTARESDSP